MITDLFSHKIHSSADDWPERLVEIAFLFSEFDGEIYDRERLENRLQEISPRSVFAPRDPSKFRDEISAYPAYLGLYRLEPSSEGWRVRVSSSTRQFLLGEEPNVGSFLRVQLALFQYPNGIGVAYYSNSNRARVQANAREKALEIISQGITISPLRIICKGLIADSDIRGLDLFKAFITYDDIYALMNAPDINRDICPAISTVQEVLLRVRTGEVKPPPSFERRFHILRHSELFDLRRRRLEFRKPVDDEDKNDLQRKIFAISNLKVSFNDLAGIIDRPSLEDLLKSGCWGKYFDGALNLPGEALGILASDILISRTTVEKEEARVPTPLPEETMRKYALRRREEFVKPSKIMSRSTEFADPEVTRIKRQRRNLKHKLIIDGMDQLLRRMGAEPMDNQHIDLYGEIPEDGSFLFEMKSGGENYLDQIRKGISQLYEYRYRYKEMINDDSILCLVVPNEPLGITWLPDYLCVDRGICLCWFGTDGNLYYPKECEGQMRPLIAGES